MKQIVWMLILIAGVIIIGGAEPGSGFKPDWPEYPQMYRR